MSDPFADGGGRPAGGASVTDSAILPEAAIASGNQVCAWLVGPPRRTPADVEVMLLFGDTPISFTNAQMLVLMARNDLCPYS